jgi:hypothetical protein
MASPACLAQHFPEDGTNMGRKRSDDWQNWRNLQLFAGKDFSDAIAVENFAAETRQYIQYLRARLARGNCPSDEPNRLLGYFWKWQQVRSDPEQLSASLSDDYHGACGPLGLQRLPVIRRDQYADAVAVETVAEDIGRYVEYLRDRVARGKRLPCHPRQLMPNFHYWLMFGDDEE